MNTKQISDGWRNVSTGIDVFVEDGMVTRATKDTANGPVSAFVYKWNKQYSAWIDVGPIKYTTFRNGYKAGRYAVK